MQNQNSDFMLMLDANLTKARVDSDIKFPVR